MKNWMKNNRVVILAFILFFIALIASAFDARLKTVSYSIYDSKISENISIALITDLHSCRYGDGQKVLIDAIKKQKPDMILMGGDMCDDIIPHYNTELLLEAIGTEYPCYYVTGNHELWDTDVNAIKTMFRSYGVTVLEGTTEVININGQQINICGIDDPYIEMHSDEKGIVKRQLENCDNTADNQLYTILLAHRPEEINTYLQYGFDLILSGHAHGGQWRVPFLINGLYAPNQGWFPKYAGGLYEFGHKKMIVSRGLARESTRVPRIFNPPELVMIHLFPV